MLPRLEAKIKWKCWDCLMGIHLQWNYIISLALLFFRSLFFLPLKLVRCQRCALSGHSASYRARSLYRKKFPWGRGDGGRKQYYNLKIQYRQPMIIWGYISNSNPVVTCSNPILTNVIDFFTFIFFHICI